MHGSIGISEFQANYRGYSGATMTKLSSLSLVWVMLIDSVKASNNSMVVGLVFISLVSSVFALLLGDNFDD